ncbi:uncharacterized protein LOC118218938 [Anguilla anguilla]|uniref:uncharacterized protein LOC118218938 n=1 Tax=Anguilla anguilla TaxID=7936 RepID=UPI0015ABA1C8|nr:uncharacterized protein LOC118218938 [Anguilla anguilla]
MHELGLTARVLLGVPSDYGCPETGGAVSKMSSSEETETDDGTHGLARKRVRVKKAESPVPSCLSMKSGHSMLLPYNFRGEFTGDQRVRVKKAESPVPSCLSMKSGHSMLLPYNFRGEFTGDQRIPCSPDLRRLDEESSEKRSPLKQGSPVQRGAVPAPDGDVPQQDSLNGCRVEGFQDLLGDSELPQLSEKSTTISLVLLTFRKRRLSWPHSDRSATSWR